MSKPENGQKLIYDYIVIGTGPAGAVIAKTLTPNRKGAISPKPKHTIF